MRPHFTHPSARRYLRYGFWLWTVTAAGAATVFGVIGAIEVHRGEWPR